MRLQPGGASCGASRSATYARRGARTRRRGMCSSDRRGRGPRSPTRCRWPCRAPGRPATSRGRRRRCAGRPRRSARSAPTARTSCVHPRPWCQSSSWRPQRTTRRGPRPIAAGSSAARAPCRPPARARAGCGAVRAAPRRSRTAEVLKAVLQCDRQRSVGDGEIEGPVGVHDPRAGHRRHACIGRVVEAKLAGRLDARPSDDVRVEPDGACLEAHGGAFGSQHLPWGGGIAVRERRRCGRQVGRHRDRSEDREGRQRRGAFRRHAVDYRCADESIAGNSPSVHRSRSTNFWILPEPVSGNSFRNTQ